MRCGSYSLYLPFCLLGLTLTYAEQSHNAWEAEDQEEKCEFYREDNGAPIPSLTTVRTCGKNGPVLADDITLFKLLSDFDRERIPERVVHAKGAGAYGYFEVTHDITKYTKAVVFEKVGKKTLLICRFSNAFGENGTPDTTRSLIGFGCKFYTSEGNWDLVGINIPIYFIRDPMVICWGAVIMPQLPFNNSNEIGSDPNTSWDFFTKRPETLSAVILIFSDLGTPMGYRYMHGYGAHTYVFVNSWNEPTYVKFLYLSDQGVKNFTAEEAVEMAGKNPDYSTSDLYENIKSGNYPSWTMYIQVMSFEEANHANFNPLDLTKIWPVREFPLIQVGKFYLNKNPMNYFAEIEQLGLSPSNMIEGIQASNDRVLQARLFAYDDTQRYRLGKNSKQLPVNRPQGLRCPVYNLHRDGFATIYNQGGKPDYFPTSFSNLRVDPKNDHINYTVNGIVGRYDLGKDADIDQARYIYAAFSEYDKGALAQNICMNIVNVTESIQEKVYKLFGLVDHGLEFGIKHCVKSLK